jgi:hypothetical protein
VYNLAARDLDHCPVQVRFSNDYSVMPSFYRSFKFEDFWTTDGECMEIIKTTWDSEVLGGTPMRAIQSKLASCQTALSRWSMRKFGNVKKLVLAKTKELEELQIRESPAVILAIKLLQAEIGDLLEKEDLKWKQRAKQNWYRNGDRNTQYFHHWANH